MTYAPIVPLREVCSINPRTARDDLPAPETLVSFVPMGAVDETTGMIVERETRPLAEVRTGYTSFAEGDVLFAKITPCMENGKVAMASDLANGIGRGSTEFYVLRPGDRILGEYIFHFVRQQRFRDQAKRNFTGTAGQQRVPKSFMEEALIPLPSIEEQRRIVDILNRAASIERLKARASAHLRDFIPALFLKMFGDRDEIASRYPTVMLKELSDIGSGVTKGRKLNNAELVDVPYLRVANVQDGYLDLGEVKTIPIRETERDKYGLQVGDLVLTEGGDPDKLGRGALWQGELPYCAHQNHVFRVRPNMAMVLGPYLKEVVGSAYGKAYFLSVAKQTTGIASINKTQLGQFPVPVPSMELQVDFTKLVEAAQARARLAEKADSLATDLSRSLLDKLLGTHGSQTKEHGGTVADPVPG